MPERIFCNDGSVKAEIYLLLPNGRESLFTSLTPPIQVSWNLKGRLIYQYVNKYIQFGSNTIRGSQKIVERVLLNSDTFVEGINSSIYKFDENSNRISAGRGLVNIDGIFDAISTRYFYTDELGNTRNPEIVYHQEIRISGNRFDTYEFKDFTGFKENHYYPKTREIDNCYVIQDKKEVHYFAEYTGQEVLRIDCIKCPESLCAIRGRNDVFCLDCEKVKSSLNRMSSALDRLLN